MKACSRSRTVQGCEQLAYLKRMDMASSIILTTTSFDAMLCMTSTWTRPHHEDVMAPVLLHREQNSWMTNQGSRSGLNLG